MRCKRATRTTFVYLDRGVTGAGSFNIRGRIDRCDMVGGAAAVVIDYKYSGDSRIIELAKQHEQGHSTQAFLYLRGHDRKAGPEPREEPCCGGSERKTRYLAG